MNDCRCIKLGRFVYEKCLKEKEEKTFETAESVSQLSGEKNFSYRICCFTAVRKAEHRVVDRRVSNYQIK